MRTAEHHNQKGWSYRRLHEISHSVVYLQGPNEEGELHLRRLWLDRQISGRRRLVKLARQQPAEGADQ